MATKILLRGSCCLLLAWSSVVAGAAGTVDWLSAAARTPTPAFASAAPAVVLVNDAILEVDERGRATEIHRVAIRILHSSGRKHALGLLMYNGASSSISNLDAWVIRDGKTIESKSKSDWQDEASNAPGAAIDENRTRSIDLSDRALAGDVFGYETRSQTPLIVAQLYWDFGETLPQLLDRLTLTLPAGFTVTQEQYGAVKPVFAQTGARSWSWTMAGEPYRPDENGAPNSARTNAELLIRMVAPAADRNFSLPAFASWGEVRDLYESLNRDQCDTSAVLTARVRELTAGDREPLAVIRAIADHVQKTRYVGINRGLRLGYGWRARKASEVFASGYGDCKDKANLMVAMLREAGIKGYRVIARLDHNRPVRDEFPSPIQFNHAIVAVAVPDSVDLPAIKTVPGLGRLLFFDPTDSHTVLGDLSLALQGNNVHIIAAEIDALMQLPEFSPESDFRLERKIGLTLAPDGTLTCKGEVNGLGQVGADMHRDFEAAERPGDLDKLVIRQLTAALKTATVTGVKQSSDRATGISSVSFDWVQHGYLQYTTPTSAVLKLDVLSRQHVPNLPNQPRAMPVELTPLAVYDELELRLPDGFVVEEVPRNAELQSTYGSFGVEYENAAGVLKLRRRLVFHKMIVPAADYQVLRKFLGDVARADRNAVLIKKQL